jgi:hypothetical protein
MKRLTFLTIFVLLTITLMMLTVSAYAANEEYRGGSGSGYAMAEYAGRQLLLW